jgi:c-di-GMP-binding flagellar brake protein YcgR
MSEQTVERRKNSRIALQIEAELQLSEKAVHRGKTRNISFSGVYMSCMNASSIPVGETGFFKLFMEPSSGADAIQFMCQVVRIDDTGTGLKFIDIDLEGYQKFKNIMLYNSPDPDKLLAELDANPGLDIRRT